MSTEPNPLERAALAYAARNWHVFPVHGIVDGQCTCKTDCGKSAGKHPCTSHGLLEATTSQATIREWWKQYPNANVAIRTGQVSGIFAVDLDVKEFDGPKAWSDLLDMHGGIDTLTALTGGGGQHWVFQLPPGIELQNQVNCPNLGDGIDIRAEGGYIVVWPSIHLSGNQYEWDAAVAPTLPPLWLTQLCPKVHAEPIKNEGEYEPWVSDALQGVGETQRNQTATRLAGYFHHQGLPEDVIYEVLSTFAERCTPPMDMRELRRTISSVTRYERQVVEHHIIDPPSFQEQVDGLKYDWPHHGVTVYLEELTRIREGIHCEITIEALLPGRQPLVHGPVSFNLTSTTTRNALVKYLGGQVQVNWAPLLDTICRLAISNFRTGAPVIDLAHYKGYPPNWSLWPFILEDETSILFGDGGNGKSYLAMAAALSIQERQNILGFDPHATGKVLYLDWEASPGAHAERLRKIGHDINDPHIKYLACSSPFHEMVRGIRRQLAEENCNIIIIDSIAAACGGEPEKAEYALRMCNAVRSLNVTALLIGHDTKSGGQSGRPFGSTFWHNEARSTLEVKKSSEPQEGLMQLGLYHRKFNDGQLSQPFGITIRFEQDAVKFERSAIGATQDFRKSLSLKDNIKAWMEFDADGPASIREIVEGTGAKEDAIRKALKRGTQLFVSSTNGTGDLWELASK